MNPADQTVQPQSPNSISRRGWILVTILSVLIVGAASAAGIFYLKTKSVAIDPAKKEEIRIADVVQKVSRIIDLPAGETPSLATITDTKALQGNPFFIHAKVGDEVLVYKVAKKAYLYDPVADQIIDVISVDQTK